MNILNLVLRLAPASIREGVEALIARVDADPVANAAFSASAKVLRTYLEEVEQGKITPSQGLASWLEEVEKAPGIEPRTKEAFTALIAEIREHGSEIDPHLRGLVSLALRL